MPKPAIGFMFRCQLPPEQLIDTARRAEAAGFDEFWLVEDCFYGGGVASAAVALASTTSVNIGLGIMPAVVRNPAFAAMELATLARLYPGRLLPGLGHGVAGWMRQVGAFPRSQLRALEETTLAVRALLRGEEWSSAGSHVNLDRVRLNLPPARVPPVALGVRGAKSLALSGRAADGTILSEGSAPAYVAWARQQIAGGSAAAGRGEPHRLTVFAWCVVDRDGAAARQALRPTLAAALASGDIATQIAPLGIAGDVAALLARGGQQRLQDEMPDQWLTQLAVAGTPAECAAAIGELAAAGADSIVLAPPFEHAGAQLGKLAAELLPRLA